MIKVPRFTKEEMKKLEKQSIENMLIFYEEEIRSIAEGSSPSKFLTRPLIKRLTAVGILERNWGRKACKTTLSKKGREWYELHSTRLP